MKATAATLNAEDVRFRGKRFHISNVYRILTSPTYAGTHQFNRRTARTGEIKPREEWVAVAVPALVTAEEFAEVQAHLAARSPKRIAPRLVGNPTLLTGRTGSSPCCRPTLTSPPRRRPGGLTRSRFPADATPRPRGSCAARCNWSRTG